MQFSSNLFHFLSEQPNFLSSGSIRQLNTHNAEMLSLCLVLPLCSSRQWIFFLSFNPIINDTGGEKAYKHSKKLTWILKICKQLLPHPFPIDKCY